LAEYRDEIPRRKYPGEISRIEGVRGFGTATERGVAGVVVGAALAIALALTLAACSPGADYPNILAKPDPRSEQTMSPDQVKQATDALISDRTQLSTSAQAAQASAVASGMAQPPATTGTTPDAGAARKP
jgi:hypothetical protein